MSGRIGNAANTQPVDPALFRPPSVSARTRGRPPGFSQARLKGATSRFVSALAVFRVGALQRVLYL